MTHTDALFAEQSQSILDDLAALGVESLGSVAVIWGGYSGLMYSPHSVAAVRLLVGSISMVGARATIVTALPRGEPGVPPATSATKCGAYFIRGSWPVRQSAVVHEISNRLSYLCFPREAKSQLKHRGRRKAAELPLDHLGKRDRRAVLQVAPDDLDRDW